MTVEIVRDLLGWSALINFAVLLLWFVLFSLAHDWIYRLHGRWFYLKPETFDVIHYSGMAGYKIGIILFNLVPFVVLHCILG